MLTKESKFIAIITCLKWASKSDNRPEEKQPDLIEAKELSTNIKGALKL